MLINELKTAQGLLKHAIVSGGDLIHPSGYLPIHRQGALDGYGQVSVWSPALAQYADDGYYPDINSCLPHTLCVHKKGASHPVREFSDAELFVCKVMHYEVLPGGFTHPVILRVETTRSPERLEEMKKERDLRGEPYLTVPPAHIGSTLLVLQFFVAGDGWHEAPLTQCRVFTYAGRPVSFDVVNPG